MAAAKTCRRRSARGLRQAVGAPQSSTALNTCLSGAMSVLDELPGAVAMSTVSRQRRLCAFLAFNFAFMVVEFVHGYTNNSLGMLSDAAHMLLDNAAVIIGLAAEHYAVKCSTNGTNSDPMRVRVLAGFANAVILMFVAFNIVLEAAVHVMVGGHDVTTHRLLPVSVAGLAVNLIGLLFVHEAHHHHLPTQQQHSHQGGDSTGGGCACSAADPNMRAIFLHVLADAMGSVAVIASTLAVQHLHWHWADPLASVTIAALIVAAVWPLVQQSAQILLEQPAVQPVQSPGVVKQDCGHGCRHVGTVDSYVQIASREALKQASTEPEDLALPDKALRRSPRQTSAMH